jgi:hypothetical protein
MTNRSRSRAEKVKLNGVGGTTCSKLVGWTVLLRGGEILIPLSVTGTQGVLEGCLDVTRRSAS